MCRKYNSLILTCEKYAASKFEKKKKSKSFGNRCATAFFGEVGVCVWGGCSELSAWKKPFWMAFSRGVVHLVVACHVILRGL